MDKPCGREGGSTHVIPVIRRGRVLRGGELSQQKLRGEKASGRTFHVQKGCTEADWQGTDKGGFEQVVLGGATETFKVVDNMAGPTA